MSQNTFGPSFFGLHPRLPIWEDYRAMCGTTISGLRSQSMSLFPPIALLANLDKSPCCIVCRISFLHISCRTVSSGLQGPEMHTPEPATGSSKSSKQHWRLIKKRRLRLDYLTKDDIYHAYKLVEDERMDFSLLRSTDPSPGSSRYSCISGTVSSSLTLL